MSAAYYQSDHADLAARRRLLSARPRLSRQGRQGRGSRRCRSSTRRSATSTTAIRINPTAAAHFVGRASTHMYKEEFQPAIADFTEAIRLSPGDEYTFLHRGIAYHSVNEPDNAIADYTEAHRINPQGRGAADQPRHRLLFEEGPVRPRHRRLHRGAEDRSEGDQRPDQPRHLRGARRAIPTRRSPISPRRCGWAC